MTGKEALAFFLGWVSGLALYWFMEGIQEPYIIKCEPTPQLIELEPVGVIIPGNAAPAMAYPAIPKHVH